MSSRVELELSSFGIVTLRIDGIDVSDRVSALELYAGAGRETRLLLEWVCRPNYEAAIQCFREGGSPREVVDAALGSTSRSEDPSTSPASDVIERLRARAHGAD